MNDDYVALVTGVPAGSVRPPRGAWRVRRARVWCWWPAARNGSGDWPTSCGRARAVERRVVRRERPHRVHVGLVLPGFVVTEGFPARELLANPITRWIVSKPELVAEAVVGAGPGGKAERYVPRGYWLTAAARVLVPGMVRRATAGGAFTTTRGSADE